MRAQWESIILTWHRGRVHYVIKASTLGGTDDPWASVVQILMHNGVGTCHSKERRTKNYRERETIIITGQTMWNDLKEKVKSVLYCKTKNSEQIREHFKLFQWGADTPTKMHQSIFKNAPLHANLQNTQSHSPVHFLLLSSFLEELISLQLKFSSQYSANHTFLLLFSRVRDVKYASNPERVNKTKEVCSLGWNNHRADHASTKGDSSAHVWRNRTNKMCSLM